MLPTPTIPDAWFPGIDTPNFTMQPNILYDAVMPRVSPAEWKVVCLVVRRTKGWREETAEITLEEMVKGTGISRSGVKLAVASLTRQGVLVAQRNLAENGGSLPTTYGLRYRQGGGQPVASGRSLSTTQGGQPVTALPIEERNPVKETEATDIWKKTIGQLRASGMAPLTVSMLKDLPVRLDGATLVVRCPRDLAERWGGYVRKAAAVPVRFES